MSLVPTREDQAFEKGYTQASTTSGVVIDHLGKRLRQVEAERDALVKVLEEIVNPVQAMRDRADAEGMQLDGHIAVNLANDPHYLRELARKGLRPVTVHVGGTR